MNKTERLTACALRADLLWFADEERPHLGGVPLGDFDAMLGPAVERLQAFFPNNRLPAPAQELWREVQGLTHRGYSMRAEPSVSPDDIVRLDNALDALIDWLTQRYKLAKSATEYAGSEPGSPDRVRDRKLTSDFLYQLVLRLKARHVVGNDEDIGKPFKLRELHGLLSKTKASISTVRRGILRLFPNGMPQYCKLCRDLTALEDHLAARGNELERELGIPGPKRTTR
ncbi:hypothetical protein [Gemmata sp.]|uniref:hypothetical protein n=1 Tax=Gemmata sp. TaxID=1914242 RepID=UPI003F7066BA